MSIITLPWQFRPNRLLYGSPTVVGGIPTFPPAYTLASYSQNVLWDVKQSLKGVGTDWTDLLGAPVATPSGNWTCYYSCDSVVAGAVGDLNDRWVTPANLINGSGAAARSWIVLKQVGIASNYQMCIALDSGQPYQASIVVSPNAGFGVPVAGSTTARPTANDEIVIVNATDIGISSNIRDTTRVHVMKSADGSATRVIMYRNNNVCGLWMLEKPARPAAGWENPSIALVLGSSSSTVTQFITQTTLNTQFNAKGRSKNYPNGVAFGSSLAIDYTNGVTSSVAPNTNEIDNTTPFYPIDLISTTFTTRGRNGALQDCWYAPWNFYDGTSLPSDDTRQFLLMGLLAMPWNRSVAYAH